MCLAVPMQVVSIDGMRARCAARGAERVVSLFLLQHERIVPGDYLMVHGGQALQTMTAAQAADAWALYDEMFAEADAAPR
ncbi:MAG: HypC/HybG/HupF family hydrogenase formation chaperone [Limimaricola sp.]|uniref:HypC/HybG/HupF family hydrogenase formation chaperone n=1 Tax=Limimaricola sp. TaxID=2211665 RepID=UPI001DD4257A|nr:HypC/HybG/HupF family hydrogenase formation chaperone [Limimaricola sp.]MBI1418933.1 HypC/HybG/HupF family hydrogenase formation chaperone [Limimaricola sp.]